MVDDRHLIRVPTHELPIETSPYDDQIPTHVLTAPEAENLSVASAVYPHFLPHTTPPLYAPYTPDHFRPSDPALSSTHEDESNTSLTYPTYPSLFAGGEPSDDIFTDPRDTSYSQPSHIYNSWGSCYPPPNLFPDATHSASPPILYPDPAPYPNFPCQPSFLSAGENQVGSADGYLPAPGHHFYAPPLHNPGPSLHPDAYHIMEPYSETLSASCPCLWAEGGIICNAMVPATRSHMNRHLHAHHGFSGSDTRQTRCRWAGCGETMQQGSIARHVVTCHLQTKVTCPMCSKKLSRQDVISKHQRVCPAASAWC